MHHPARAHELGGGQLGMDYTRTGGHPLHIPRSELPRVSTGILVFHITRQHVGHRLESSMRMIGRAFRFTRSNIHRSHLIKQQKRIKV